MTGIRGLCLSRRKEQISQLKKKVPFGWTFFFLENLFCYILLHTENPFWKDKPAHPYPSRTVEQRRHLDRVFCDPMYRCAAARTRVGPRGIWMCRRTLVKYIFGINYITKTDFTPRAVFWVSRGRRSLSPGFSVRLSPSGWKTRGIPGGCL